MQYIIVIGIFQALIAILLLWRNQRRHQADHLLILLVICIATHLSIKFVIFNFVQDMHVRQQMNTFIAYCYGPLLYLYTLKLHRPDLIPARKWYVFIPFVIGMSSYLSITAVLLYTPQQAYHLLYWYNELSFWTLIGSDLFFALSVLSLLRQQALQQLPERRLVNRLAYGFLLTSVLALIFYFVPHSISMDYSWIIRSVVYGILVYMCVLIIRYKYVGVPAPAGIVPTEFREEVHTEIPLNMQDAPATDTPATTRKAGLSEQEQEEIWLSLEQYLKESKIFTDTDLSLDKLAQSMGISKYHISETLNHYGATNFYRYINTYRIGYARDRIGYFLHQGISINMLSIAFEAGFKAKSSFNRYFKDTTGLTPTEYLKSLQHNTGLLLS